MDVTGELFDGGKDTGTVENFTRFGKKIEIDQSDFPKIPE
jgi:hypothetical protein